MVQIHTHKKYINKINMTVVLQNSKFDTKVFMLYTMDWYFNLNYFGNKKR